MWDDDIEKSMLYYLIFEKEDYLLDEEDFVSEKNKKIIKAINELKAEKQEISLLTIKSKIKANGTQVLEYLSSLSNYIRVSTADKVYELLTEESKKRKLLKLLEINKQTIADCESIDILAEKIIKDINAIEQTNKKEKNFVEQVAEAMEKIEENTLKGTDYSLYTGIRDLDNLTCGLHKQELTIVRSKTSELEKPHLHYR